MSDEPTTDVEKVCPGCMATLQAGDERVLGPNGDWHLRCWQDRKQFIANRDTDAANGEEFARMFKGRAIWVAGLDWLIYDGRRWVPDDEELVRLRLIGTLTRWLREKEKAEPEKIIVKGEEKPNPMREAYRRRALRLEGTRGVHGALFFATGKLATPLRMLDANPLLINYPNGTYDATYNDEKRKRVGLRKHDPKDYITRLCPTEWDSTAEDATWDKVVVEVFNGDDPHAEAKLGYLQRFAGYTLLGLTHEKAIMVPHGPRDTAKSTVTEALYRALGDIADGGYATTWDAEVIEAGTKVNRNEKLDKARPARMIITGELEKGSRMADGFVKRYSGGDTVDACAKYKPSYSYRPQGKLWLPTNYVPRSADKAVQGRLGLLPFRNVPEKIDRSIKDHLDRDEGAHRAVLAWAMRGLEDYLDARQVGNEHPLGETPWLDVLLREYAKGSDPLRDFIEVCFQEIEVRELKGGEDDGSPHVDDVWAAYQAWATDNVPKPLKRRTLEYALEEHGYEKQRVPSHGGSMRWRGLMWAAPEDIPQGIKVAVKAARASLEMQRRLM